MEHPLFTFPVKGVLVFATRGWDLTVVIFVQEFQELHEEVKGRNEIIFFNLDTK